MRRVQHQRDRPELPFLGFEFKEGAADVALDQAGIVFVDVIQLHFMATGETVDFHRRY